MPSPTRTSSRSAIAAAAVLAAVAVTGPSKDARADDVASSPKGIVGGALLGADVVTIGESLFGVRPGWAYAVGAVVGAGGGGALGYLAQQGSSDGKVPTYLLAGGLALVIPAIVLTLNATRYFPQDESTEDNVPSGPPAEPGVPVAAPSTPSKAPSTPAASPAPSPPPPPQSLLDVGGGMVRVGVPVPDVRPVFSTIEQRQYGLRAETELRMSVLHLVF